MNPKVTVCVQTYNHVEFIGQCLDSILSQQTQFNFEVVLGEDESNDGTREICKRYAENFPEKIRLFQRSRKDVIHINDRPTGRFNMMENLKAAKGKYIAILEGDDYWTDPLKLQRQFDILESNPEVVMCHHWQKVANLENGEWVEKDAPKEGQGYLPEAEVGVEKIFTNQMRVKARTMMFRNYIDDNFFPSWFTKVAFGDVPLCFLLGKHGRFHFMDTAMAVYRQNPQGSSRSGIDEQGMKLFQVQHYKNWIKIWDYANMHYNYEFGRAAQATVDYFYTKIMEFIPDDLASYKSLLKFQHSERPLTGLKKWKNSIYVYKRTISFIFRKMKNKISRSF